MAAVAAVVFSASASSADTFTVVLVSQTNSTVTLGWTPQPGYGYLFSLNGQLVSRTNDPSRSSVKFSKGTSYDIDVIVKGANGHYPPVAPPPPLALCANGIDDDADTKIDLADPGCTGPTDNDETDVPPQTGASVYLSPSGNDTNACTATAQCRSVTRGYSVAADGATIQMADGFYPCVTLTGTKHVTFSAASGAKPWIACNNTIRGLYSDGYSLQFVNAANITMNGIYAAGVEWKEGTGVRDITFNNVHVTCLSNDSAHFELWGGLCNAKIEGAATNLTMNGGEVGPTIDNEAGSYPGSSRIMGGSNIVLNGVTFHHNEREPGGHSECLMIEGGNPVKVVNSRFLSCNTYNIFITCFPCASGSYGSQPDNVLIENNYFGPGPQYFAIELRDTNPRSRIDYRYNTFYKFVGVGAGYGDFRGNIVAHSGGCPGSSYTVKYNVWGDDIGRVCGDSTNVSVRSSSFTTDGAGYDLATGHLGTSSAAIGKGDPGNFPVSDIDGQTRPIGVVDAGSDER